MKLHEFPVSIFELTDLQYFKNVIIVKKWDSMNCYRLFSSFINSFIFFTQKRLEFYALSEEAILNNHRKTVCYPFPTSFKMILQNLYTLFCARSCPFHQITSCFVYTSAVWKMSRAFPLHYCRCPNYFPASTHFSRSTWRLAANEDELKFKKISIYNNNSFHSF